MNVYFSDRPAYYFLKKYVVDNHPDLKIDWHLFDFPTFRNFYSVVARIYRFRTIDNFTELLSKVEEDSVICFSLFSVGDYYSFVLFNKVLRNLAHRKRLKIVVGGPMLYWLDEKEMLDLFPIDHLVLGAGEQVFADIIRSVANGRQMPRLIHGDIGANIRFPDPSMVNSKACEQLYSCSINLEKCSWGLCKFCHHQKQDEIELQAVESFSDKFITTSME